MKKAFTIVELLLAMVLLASLLATSGIVFRVAAKSHMTAAATAEIARKLRGITDQLNADFKGLRKDAEFFVVWVPNPILFDDTVNPQTATAAQIERYERLDRIMFFADGDFQSYNEWPDYLVPPTRGDRIIQGTTARIAYMLTKDGLDHLDSGGALVQGKKAENQDANKRILGRSQHILTSDSTLVDVDPTDPAQTRIRWIIPANIDGLLVPPLVLGQVDETGAFTQANENYYEFDNLTFNEWVNLPYIPHKQEIYSVIADIIVDFDPDDGIVPTENCGMVVNVDSKPPLNVHQLLSEGVGEFSVQGWYDDPILGPRWYPQLDLTPADGVIIDDKDTDFPMHLTIPNRLHDTQVSGRIYNPLEDFNSIPGLGRALKFTFTLYDSRGVFENGKKFTHIVYLDE